MSQGTLWSNDELTHLEQRQQFCPLMLGASTCALSSSSQGGTQSPGTPLFMLSWVRDGCPQQQLRLLFCCVISVSKKQRG